MSRVGPLPDDSAFVENVDGVWVFDEPQAMQLRPMPDEVMQLIADLKSARTPGVRFTLVKSSSPGDGGEVVSS